MKYDSLLSKPPLLFPNLFGEPTIEDFSCVSSSIDAPIVDHSQDSSKVGPSFNNGEDKLLIEDPLDPSSVLSGDTKNEFVHFSSTHLFDLSDHEDAKEFIDFSNRGDHDPLTSIIYHDHDSIVVDLSNPTIYDDPLDDGISTPKIVDTLQPELMVMSGPHSLGASLTSNHEIVQSPEAPHHPFVCIEDPYHS